MDLLIHILPFFPGINVSRAMRQKGREGEREREREIERGGVVKKKNGKNKKRREGDRQKERPSETELLGSKIKSV